MIEKLAAAEQRYDDVERLLADPEVSSDYSQIEGLLKEQASMKDLVSLSRELRKLTKELSEVRAMQDGESDQGLAILAKEEQIQLEERIKEVEDGLRIELIPRDPNDDKNVIMEIRAGAGGDEAGLFAADLYRLYTRYAQRKGWKTEMVEASDTGLGAIKEVVFQLKGKGAYSLLKHESGVHRVQRVPMTESSGRIHTSAATVAVLPEAEEVDIDIHPDDLQIDIFHASGHGGQNVQKVATAIRITHTPTGVMAICQDERSQLKNKDKAMSVLRSRLLARETERRNSAVSEERRAQIGTGDRSERVRTYNFPQNRVTDHRVGVTSHALDEVLDGDIDFLIDALIEREQARNLQVVGL